jgi:hypothetical protein
VDVADETDEARDAADIAPAGAEPAELGADVERLGLDADHRSAAGHRREEGDLVAVAHRGVVLGELLIDRALDDAGRRAGLGEARMARAEPGLELGDGGDLRRQRQLLLGRAGALPTSSSARPTRCLSQAK